MLHHLKHYAPDARSTILFAGFQAGGTRGAAMVAGAEQIKLHGRYVPVRATVRNLDMLSAHADADEIMRWLQGFKAAPRMTFITHGEPAASDALRLRIEEELGWPCVVAEHGTEGGPVMSGDIALPVLAAGQLRARRIGIDTQHEAVVLMHKDCSVCKSEGFSAHTRILLRAARSARDRNALPGHVLVDRAR